MTARAGLGLALTALLLASSLPTGATAREERVFTTTEQYLAAMGDCGTVDACFAAIDSVIDVGLGVDKDNHLLRDRLLAFGDEAKRRLLDKVLYGNAGWYNLAGDLLSDWPDLKPEDVPPLARALKRKSGSWVARALGRIGTPEAVAALVDDLNTSGNQTSFALARLGPKVLPSLFPVLEDEKRFRAAAGVIREMGQPAAVAASEWASIAADERQPRRRRLAAVRGLEAMERHAAPYLAPVRALLTGADRQLAEAAFETLKVARDPAALPRVAADCNRFSPALSPFASGNYCLADIARFGDAARSAIPQVRRFLASPNAADRAAAIAVLGLLDDRESAPAFLRGLDSTDWREAQTAARTLGWLGIAEARATLAQMASTHWLPEVRREASAALAGIDSPAGHSARPARLWDRGDERQDGLLWPLYPNERELDPGAECLGQTWTWEGWTIDTRGSSTVSAVFDDGVILGTDNGEWGGALFWRPKEGPSVGLAGENVSGVARAGDSAVVAFGLAHMGLDYGELMRFDRDGQGGWAMHPIGRLTGDSGAVMRLADDLFAVNTPGRVIVFSSRKILGLATCAD